VAIPILKSSDFARTLAFSDGSPCCSQALRGQSCEYTAAPVGASCFDNVWRVFSRVVPPMDAGPPIPTDAAEPSYDAAAE
jgi:hypothetical protein